MHWIFFWNLSDIWLFSDPIWCIFLVIGSMTKYPQSDTVAAVSAFILITVGKVMDLDLGIPNRRSYSTITLRLMFYTRS